MDWNETKAAVCRMTIADLLPQSETGLALLLANFSCALDYIEKLEGERDGKWLEAYEDGARKGMATGTGNDWRDKRIAELEGYSARLEQAVVAYSPWQNASDALKGAGL